MAKQILLVDDHEIVRLGLKQMVEGTDIEISGEASSAQEAIETFSQGAFDLIIVDHRLSDADGFQLVSDLKQKKHNLNFLLFSASDSFVFLAKAVSLGINGFVSKFESADKIMDAIRRTSLGETIWTKEELKKASSGAATAIETVSGVPLTTREGEVLQRLSHGMTNKEIAIELGISYETVKEHVQHIFRKVGVTDRTQAAVWAVRNNLI